MGDKSPKPSEEYSQSTQDIWGPQGDALSGLYKDASSWFNNNSGGIQGGANQAGDLSQGAINSVAGPWQQNLQGGNLAGYDIGSYLSGQIGQNRDINGGTATAQQFGAGPGVSSNQMGPGMNLEAGPGVQNHSVGQLNSTEAQNSFDRNVGPGGSLDNMKGMYRQDANNARDDMLGSMDARAAASGMSGGSGHGNAIGRGQEGINQNLQSQMAQTGYDAYNRDLDRQLGIAGDKDTMNQQRAGWDQQNSFNTQNANQQNRFQVGQANQGNQFKYDEANQGSDLQAQMANLQNMFQTNQANQGANLSAQQGNQQANIQAGQANQNYAQQQQQQLGDLMGQQQGSSETAIGQQEQIQNFINGPLQSIMQSAGGLQMLQSLLGNPQALTQSEGGSNGATPPGSGSFNVGGIGGQWG